MGFVDLALLVLVVGGGLFLFWRGTRRKTKGECCQ